MERHHKFSIWYVILGIWIVLLIQNKVTDIIRSQYRTALQILKAKRQVLDQGAEVLLQTEKIEGDALRALLKSADVQGADPEAAG